MVTWNVSRKLRSVKCLLLHFLLTATAPLTGVLAKLVTAVSGIQQVNESDRDERRQVTAVISKFTETNEKQQANMEKLLAVLGTLAPDSSTLRSPSRSSRLRSRSPSQSSRRRSRSPSRSSRRKKHRKSRSKRRRSRSRSHRRSRSKKLKTDRDAWEKRSPSPEGGSTNA